MATIEINVTNSTDLESKVKKLEIDMSTTVLELKKHLKDEFELSHLKFIVFLYNKVKKKWFILDDDTKLLTKYPIKGKDNKLNIKNPINIEKVKE